MCRHFSAYRYVIFRFSYSVPMFWHLLLPKLIFLWCHFPFILKSVFPVSFVKRHDRNMYILSRYVSLHSEINPFVLNFISGPQFWAHLPVWQFLSMDTIWPRYRNRIFFERTVNRRMISGKARITSRNAALFGFPIDWKRMINVDPTIGVFLF